MSDKGTVVYAILFGPYDVVLPAPYGGILFTDQDVTPQGWDVRKVEPLHTDPRYAVRYYWRTADVVPDADYAIIHGANGRLQMDPTALAGLLPADVDFGVFRHPHRDNVYDEARACINMRKDNAGVIEAQMERYRAEGFPGDELSACLLMVRRITERAVPMERAWWNEIVNGSYRDQLSFDYARWKTNTPIVYLDDLGLTLLSAIKVRRHVRPT